MRIFFITGFLLSMALFSSPVGKWVNTQQQMTIEFKNNGKFTWKVGQNLVKGSWKQLNQSMLQTYANGQTTQYAFQVKNNMLGLMASNGAQIYLTKAASNSNKPQGTINKKFLGTWFTTNGQIIFKIKFNKNGIYSVIINNKKTNGKWSINGNIINTSMNNQQVQYSYVFKNGLLILAQSKQSYMILSRKKSYMVNILKKYSKNRKTSNNTVASGSNKPLTDAQFMYLLENYTKMHPNTVYTYMTRLSKSQRSWIPIYKTWYNMMVYIVCQGTLAYNTPQERQMCANSKAEYQKSINLRRSLSMSTSSIWDQGKSDANNLLISYKCKYGLIDKGSCRMYMGMKANMNRMQNETSNTIIKNMEPLPCTKHYEQGSNVYLGCW